MGIHLDFLELDMDNMLLDTKDILVKPVEAVVVVSVKVVKAADKEIVPAVQAVQTV